MEESLRDVLIDMQRGEITEHGVYQALARREKSAANRDVLNRIAADELRHYEFWAERTGARPGPDRLKRLKFSLLARVLGLTFAVKLMERGEEGAQVVYGRIAEAIPEAADVLEDEEDHEKQLMAMIDEERLRYMSSVVLGLSDALVELTGALAGMTLALRDGRLIAAIGLITGIAAAMSMSASEYLSTKADEGHPTTEEGRGDPDADHKVPVKSAAYTGLAYLLTVIVLVLPFILLGNPLVALAIAVACGLVIIGTFSFYNSVARDLPFGRRFLEMAGLSLGVAAISFGIGSVVRKIFGVDV